MILEILNAIHDVFIPPKPMKEGFIIKIIAFQNPIKYYTRLDTDQIFCTEKKDNAKVFDTNEEAAEVLKVLRKIKAKYIIINILPLHEEK